MLIKTQALVLKVVRYGDNKCIVDLLAEELGRVDVSVSISNSLKARFKRSMFQPLNIVEVEIDFRQNRSLQSLKSVSIAYPYSTVNTDIAKMCMSMFLSEFLYNVTKNEQQNSLLFNYIRNSMEWLDAKNTPIANFHLVFMMRLAKFIGFSPNIDDYIEGCFFDLRNGAFTDEQPFHGDVVMPEDARRIVTLLRMNYENMHLFAMSRTERNRFLDVLLKYYSIHVPNFPELKSLEVIRSLYS